jgi:hypothetical protein
MNHKTMSKKGGMARTAKKLAACAITIKKAQLALAKKRKQKKRGREGASGMPQIEKN